MNCFAHPDSQGVAQCNRCNKVMCKECANRCVDTDDKYVGLCDDCILKVGIDCSYHPSKQAVTRCDKCGKFLCDDCFDATWDSVVGKDDKTARYCHVCVGNMVDNKMSAEADETRHIAKVGMIWVGIFSVLGLIIGLAVTISDGKDAGGVLGGAWLGIGIGCSVRVLLSCIGSMFLGAIGKLGSGYGEPSIKSMLVGGLIGTLILGIIFCTIGVFTGPIIPLVYMLIRRGQLKKIGPIIERNDELCATLRNAHTKPGDQATKSEIHMGADTFVEDMLTIISFQRPILKLLK